MLFSCLRGLFIFVFNSADVISTVEFNQTGEFLATGDKGGRVVIFQREPQVTSFYKTLSNFLSCFDIFSFEREQ